MKAAICTGSGVPSGRTRLLRLNRPCSVLEAGGQHDAGHDFQRSVGLVPALADVDVLRGAAAGAGLDLAQAVGGERLGALADEERLVEGEGRGAAPRGHRVLVRDRGGDDGAERDQEDRDQQRDAALRVRRRRARTLPLTAARAHPAISMMRTILPQSSVSSVISTASGRWRSDISIVGPDCTVLVRGGHWSCHCRCWSR